MDPFLSEIRSVLSTTPDRWQRLVQSLPEELLRRKPGPGEWSALECLSHLIDTEPVYTYRIYCFQAGKDFSSFDPDTEGSKVNDQPATALAAALARLRQESLGTLETISAADLDRPANHSELGPVTLRQMLNNWAAHDLMHTVQAERALMQPFIDGCGPWQIYYDDHWVGAKKQERRGK